MRLSEAIRLGAMLKPQGDGTILSLETSCALGAAADALGLVNDYNRYDQLGQLFDSVVRSSRICPKCIEDQDDLLGIVFHLNDDHKWTREQIADFVAGVEAAQEIESPETADAVRLSVDQPGVPLRASV